MSSMWNLLLLALFALQLSVGSAGPVSERAPRRQRFSSSSTTTTTTTTPVVNRVVVTSKTTTTTTATTRVTSTTATSTTTRAAATPSVATSGMVYQNAVYFTNWGTYDRNFQAYNLPASQLSYVLYAFVKVLKSGEVVSADPFADVTRILPGDNANAPGNNAYGNVKQLYLMKKKYRNLKVLMSIGGWTYGANFSTAASTPATRALFASSAVALVRNWGLDGIDIDWEYPSTPTDASNFLLLLQSVRQSLDAYASQSAPGYHFLLTAATSAAPDYYNALRLREMGAVLDFFNLMGYDYAGDWSARSGHQSNIYASTSNPNATPFSTDAAVTGYIAAGVPASKIVLGMPLYGRAFAATGGPGQPFNGVGTAGSSEAGVWDYSALPRPGASENFDGVSGATWSYDAGARVMVTYDGVEAVRHKVVYLKGRGLGGAMFWEASGDRNGTAAGGSLVATSAGGVGSLDSRPNLLSYPGSSYANIAAGMP